MKVLEFLKHNWIRMVIAFVLGLLLMVLYNASQASIGANSWGQLSYYRDGAFIAGAALFFIGLLSLVAGWGAFDSFSFFISRKKKEDGSKENYGEYVNRKKEDRAKINLSFLSYIIIALVYVIFSLITFFILK